MQLPDIASHLDVLGYQDKVKKQPETKDNAIYRMPVEWSRSRVCSLCSVLVIAAIVKSNVAE
jgi:hypothetical protein